MNLCTQPPYTCAVIHVAHATIRMNCSQNTSLQAVLVGPECGAWKLTEMVVSNSREQLTQHFVCRQHLGTKDGKGAAVLPAVPPGAVVYGTGETAVLLSAVRLSHQAASRHSRRRRAYGCAGLLWPGAASVGMIHRILS